jgi:hypothetical protein
MKTPRNEKLNSSIGNLTAAALDQIRVLNLGWNVFGSD